MKKLPMIVLVIVSILLVIVSMKLYQCEHHGPPVVPPEQLPGHPNK